MCRVEVTRKRVDSGDDGLVASQGAEWGEGLERKFVMTVRAAANQAEYARDICLMERRAEEKARIMRASMDGAWSCSAAKQVVARVLVASKQIANGRRCCQARGSAWRRAVTMT